MHRSLSFVLGLLALAGCAARGAAHKQPPTAPVPAPGNPTPVYPDEARRRGLEGVVEVEAEVLPTGSVGNARVRTGGEPLGSAALAAVRQWQFQPARRDGKAVSARVVIPVRFRLEIRPWRLVASVPGHDGTLRPADATFPTRRACEDAALATAGDVRGCVIDVGAPDEAVVPIAQVTDPPPPGWVVLLLAPGATGGVPLTAAPLDQWRVVGSFVGQRVCDGQRTLEHATPAVRGVAKRSLRCAPPPAPRVAQ
ncbi:MAG: energy transducer TonB [bacterium]|nr:energy transducer TonB [bacterium]